MPQLRQDWRIPLDERREIAEQARSRSLRQVAGDHGIDPATVANIKKEFGVPANRRGQMKMWPGVHYISLAVHKGWPLRPRNPAPLRWAA